MKHRSIGLTNLFSPEARTSAEVFTDLVTTETFRLERIVSTGQATPAGEWLVQDRAEWVVLLSGAAGIQFEGEDQIIVMRGGDYVTIPPGCRHRVAWTDTQQPTVWLAIHYVEPNAGSSE